MKTKLLALVFGIGLAAASIGGATAKITTSDVACINDGGHLAPGQQVTCVGAGQTQDTESSNPAGHLPPGQN